jgi:hypothetical protein
MSSNGKQDEVKQRLQEQQDHLREVEYGRDATDKREADEDLKRIARFRESLAKQGLTIQSISSE